MSWTLALLLGLLQGLTEFLPVSSSGHLVLAQNLAERLSGRRLASLLAFDLLVHVGTLLAVVVYFRQDLRRLLGSALTPDRLDPHNGRRELLLLATALVPTAIVGLALRNLVEDLLQQPALVAGFIGVTGLALLSTRALAPVAGTAAATLTPSWLQTLGIGLAQGIAVVPGLSRSGLTIAAGLALGMAPRAAFRWSFLISIPAIAGASALELTREPAALAGLGWPALAAALVAAGVALAALALLARLLDRARFHHFAWYCFTVAIAGVWFFTGGETP
jgi:undecaprenyl-diphosphatase